MVQDVFASAGQRLTRLVLVVSLAFSPSLGYAQNILASALPEPGTMIGATHAFTPVILKGMVIHPQDPLKFDFLMDTGTSRTAGEDLRVEADKAIKYFLASLTVPDESMWVNLSPYEKDRVIPDAFGKTVMGRDLLGEDYVLKQLASSLLYPESDLGREFWSKLYEVAQRELGTSDIDVSQFNRVWIQPDVAQVWENDGKAVIVQSHLKVLLETDYKAQDAEGKGQTVSRGSESAKQVFRQVLLPVIEKEVNEGAHFARLRQIYSAMILASWYKIRLKESLLAKAYADQNKVAGVEFQDSLNKDAIYARYLQAVNQGVYNYIREERDAATGELAPRKYFSGGFSSAMLQKIVSAGLIMASLAGLSPAARADVDAAVRPQGDMVLVAAGVQDIGPKEDLSAGVDAQAGATDEKKTAAEEQAAAFFRQVARGDGKDFMKKFHEVVALGKLAMPQVLASLKDPNAEVRKIAIEAATSMRDKTAVPILLTMFKDEDIDVARTAVLALGKIGDKSVAPALIEALGSYNIRLVAIMALGTLGDNRAVPGLIDVARNADYENGIRGEALRALGKIGDKKAAPFVLGILKNGPWQIQDDAILALETLIDPSVGPELIEILKNEHQEMRKMASTLAKVGKKAAEFGPIPYLVSTQNDILKGIVSLLVNLKDKSAVPLLVEVMNDGDADLKRYVAFSLVELGETASVPVLIELLRDERGSVRAKSAGMLGKAGDKRAVPGLRAALKDETEEVRASAAWALGMIGDKSALADVREAFKSGDKYVRPLAAWALWKMGDKTSILPSLYAGLKDPDWYVRWKNVSVLGDVGDKTTIPVLISVVKDPEEMVGRNALAALKKLGWKPEIKALQQAGFSSSDIDILKGAFEKSGVSVVNFEPAMAAEFVSGNSEKAMSKKAMLLGLTAAALAGIWFQGRTTDKATPPKGGEALVIEKGVAANEEAALARLVRLTENITEGKDLSKIRVFFGKTIDEIFDLEYGHPGLPKSWELRTKDGKIFIPGMGFFLSDVPLNSLDPFVILANHRPSQELTGPLVTLTQHPNPLVRMSAALSLKKGVWAMQDDEVGALLKLLDDANDDVRLAGILALGPKGWGRNSPYFSLNSTENGYVQSFHPDKRIFPKLVKFLSSGIDAERFAAADTMALILDQRAIAPLLETVNDKNQYVREKALQTLNALNAVAHIYYERSIITALSDSGRQGLKTYLTGKAAGDEKERARILLDDMEKGRPGSSEAQESTGSKNNEKAMSLKSKVATWLAITGLATGAIIHGKKEGWFLSSQDKPGKDLSVRTVSYTPEGVRAVVERLAKRVEEGSATREMRLIAMFTFYDKTVPGSRTINLLNGTEKVKLENNKIVGVFQPNLHFIDGALSDGRKWEMSPFQLLALFPTVPEETRGPLVSLLSHSNKDVRIAAALAIKRNPDPRAVTPLLEMVKDSDPEVRYAAILGLGTASEHDITGYVPANGRYSFDKRIFPALTEKIESTKSVYMKGEEVAAIVDTLGKLGDRRAVRFLLRSDFSSENVTLLREKSLDVLGAVDYLNVRASLIGEDDREIVGEYLIKKMKGPKFTPADQYVQAKIADGWFVAPPSMKFNDARIQSMRALAKMGYVEGLDAMLDILKGTDEELALEAMKVVTGLAPNDPRVAAALREIALRPESSILKGEAILTLVRIGDKKAFDFLVRTSIDPSEDLKELTSLQKQVLATYVIFERDANLREAIGKTTYPAGGDEALGENLWQTLAGNDEAWQTAIRKGGQNLKREAVRAAVYAKDKEAALNVLLYAILGGGDIPSAETLDEFDELARALDKMGYPRFKKAFDKFAKVLLEENVNVSNSTAFREYLGAIMQTVYKGHDFEVFMSSDRTLTFKPGPKIESDMSEKEDLDKGAPSSKIEGAGEQKPNQAMVENFGQDLGGIDLDARKLDLQIKRDANGAPLPVSEQSWGTMDIRGFVPVIYTIEPVNMPLLLGLNSLQNPPVSADAGAVFPEGREPEFAGV